jgi:CRP-like cAMP-binding protein
MTPSDMKNRPPPRDRPLNRLLRALPPQDFDRLLPNLKTIPLRRRDGLLTRGEPVDFVYFPNGGVASITVGLADGTVVETGTVGVEGMVGLEAFYARSPLALGDSMMQVPDTSAERLPIAPFRAELDRCGALADAIGEYALVALAQMMQSVACNARHPVNERCPRWLLSTHDRVGRDEFHLSQDFLAIMLGVRRQSVTVAAGILQAAGIIAYRHGIIRILDRPALEAASCECYALQSAAIRRKT